MILKIVILCWIIICSTAMLFYTEHFYMNIFKTRKYYLTYYLYCSNFAHKNIYYTNLKRIKYIQIYFFNQ